MAEALHETQRASSKKGSLPLSKETLLKIHDLMVKSRALEERLIKIYKTGDNEIVEAKS